MTAQPELHLAPEAPVTPTAVDAGTVAAAIGSYRFTYRAEDQLQEGLAAAFAAAGLPVQREVWLSPSERIDFLVGRVGVEVKVAGSPSVVLSQLQRYATHERIGGLVLVTTRARHRALPAVVGGLPLRIVHLGGVV